MSWGQECHPRGDQDRECRCRSIDIVSRRRAASCLFLLLGDSQEKTQDEHCSGRVPADTNTARIFRDCKHMPVPAHSLMQLRGKASVWNQGVVQREQCRVLVSCLYQDGYPAQQELQVKIRRAHGETAPLDRVSLLSRLYKTVESRLTVNVIHYNIRLLFCISYYPDAFQISLRARVRQQRSVPSTKQSATETYVLVLPPVDRTS